LDSGKSEISKTEPIFMKKTLFLSLSFAALSTLATASVVSCTVTPVGTITGYSTSTADINGSFVNTGASVAAGNSAGSQLAFSCPTLDAGAGSIITGYSLLGQNSYTGGPFGTTSGTQVTLSYLVNGGPFTGATQSSIVTGGNAANPTGAFQIGSTVGGNQSYGGFTVSLNSLVNSGTVGASTAQVVLSYSTQSVITSGTPEPTTLGLVGSALVGIGFLVRRKK
jgi:PEP-CTERM motif